MLRRSRRDLFFSSNNILRKIKFSSEVRIELLSPPLSGFNLVEGLEQVKAINSQVFIVPLINPDFETRKKTKICRRSESNHRQRDC